jgi:Alw26I/Eco31I/Esp3I family type II restriction m6 adenine DNA methyltransferase
LRHLAVISKADSAKFNGKSVQQRAAGRFYTHELIGRALTRQVAERIPPGSRSVSVIDPFAGDGRLVAWLAPLLAERGIEHLDASLWDQDEGAVQKAGCAVEEAAAAVGLSTHVDTWVGDTFDRAAAERQRWTAVVTNPPWELLKPDGREMKMLPDELRDEYVAELKTFDRRLASEFPISQPSRRFAGWGTNLSRVGTEVALRLTADGGVSGVVCPSSLLADGTTAALRRWLLEHFALVDAVHYPAEARLFEGVDMPCCTFVAVRGGQQNGMRLTRVSANHRVIDQTRISLSRDWLQRRDYAIPIEFGANGIALLENLDHHPQFAKLELPTSDGLWAGRELDETRRASFTLDHGAHPFVRSLHVRRLRPVEPPAEFVDTSMRRLPASSQRVRLVWRDISRPSQKRRVHASLLPTGCVTGNSVSVAYFRDESLPRTLALLAIVSSLPFEFQVRSLLMTHHVSLSVVRATRIPRLDRQLIAPLAKAALACLEERACAESDLEVAVARAYGLDREEWNSVASHFELSAQERDALRDSWSAIS